MLDKKNLIEIYKKFLHDQQLLNHQAVLGFGGACVMYGLREYTGDLDISISFALHHKLHMRKHYPTKSFMLGSGRYLSLQYSPVISLAVLPATPPTGTITTRIIDGVACDSPERVLYFKQLLGRSKDESDILALAALIAA
jgi:hypothetical protein